MPNKIVFIYFLKVLNISKLLVLRFPVCVTGRVYSHRVLAYVGTYNLENP